MSESALKAFELLFHLARSGGSSLAKLSRDTGWDKATALRYLTAMEKKDVVERRDGDWTLGLALLELASRVPVTENIANRVKPVLIALAKNTGESANLSAMVGSDLMYIAKADGMHALRLRINPGDRLPLYCTAGGKCILAHLSPQTRAQYIEDTQLSAIAPNTITDPDKLLEEIERTIRRGWAVDDEELEPGLICYGMPLELPRYGFSGAISVSGPSGRMSQAQDQILAALKAATVELQESMSGGFGEEQPTVFGPGRGGFRNADWHRPGSEIYE